MEAAEDGGADADGTDHRRLLAPAGVRVARQGRVRVDGHIVARLAGVVHVQRGGECLRGHCLPAAALFDVF